MRRATHEREFYVTGPSGKRLGPFPSQAEAVKRAKKVWPSAPQDDRTENPDAWDMETVEI